jgi:hypothetical protein
VSAPNRDATLIDEGSAAIRRRQEHQKPEKRGGKEDDSEHEDHGLFQAAPHKRDCEMTNGDDSEDPGRFHTEIAVLGDQDLGLGIDQPDRITGLPAGQPCQDRRDAPEEIQQHGRQLQRALATPNQGDALDENRKAQEDDGEMYERRVKIRKTRSPNDLIQHRMDSWDPTLGTRFVVGPNPPAPTVRQGSFVPRRLPQSIRAPNRRIASLRRRYSTPGRKRSSDFLFEIQHTPTGDCLIWGTAAAEASSLWFAVQLGTLP